LLAFIFIYIVSFIFLKILSKYQLKESYKFFKDFANVLSSKNFSDEYKEQYFKKNSVIILKNSFVYLIFFVVLICILFYFERLVPQFYEFLISLQGILFSIFTSMLIFKFKKND